jgi:hypothetical protein
VSDSKQKSAVAKSTRLNLQAYFHPSYIMYFMVTINFIKKKKKCQTVVLYARKGISIDTQYTAGDHLHFGIASSASGEESQIVLTAGLNFIAHPSTLQLSVSYCE